MVQEEDVGKVLLYRSGTHAFWRLDSTWKNYVYREQASLGAGLLSSFHNHAQIPSGNSETVTLWEAGTPENTLNTELVLENPRSMNSGYADTNASPVVGNATYSIREENSVDYLVGTPVVVNVSAILQASTSFDHVKPSTFKIDLAQLIPGAAYLVSPTIRNTQWSKQYVALATGILSSATGGKWSIDIQWSVFHKTAVDDAYDSFSVFFEVTVFGYTAIRTFVVAELPVYEVEADLQARKKRAAEQLQLATAEAELAYNNFRALTSP